jgi:tRNA(adenine34) deaminase
MKNDNKKDFFWMQQALAQAHQAMQVGEVPVGAVLVLEDELISRSANAPIRLCDPTAHAEILALRAGATQLNNYRLPGATLYVTLEPCAMCAGAIVQARLARVVFGADDSRAGAVHSIFKVFDEKRLNHRLEWEGGVCAEESSALLKQFFQARR